MEYTIFFPNNERYWGKILQWEVKIVILFVDNLKNIYAI